MRRRQVLEDVQGEELRFVGLIDAWAERAQKADGGGAGGLFAVRLLSHDKRSYCPMRSAQAEGWDILVSHRMPHTVTQQSPGSGVSWVGSRKRRRLRNMSFFPNTFVKDITAGAKRFKPIIIRARLMGS